MDTMTLDILSHCLRAVLYNHLALVFMLYLLYRACGPARHFKWGPIITLLELRMAVSIWVVEIAVFFYGQESWYPLLLQLTSLIHGVLVIFTLHYFQGSLGKTLFAALWAETIAVGCQMGAWALAYWGTGEMYVMTCHPLQPRDALMVVSYLPLCALCSMAMTPVLKAYRGYRPRHPRLLLGLGLLVLFSRIIVNIYSALPKGTYRLTVDLVLCNIMAVLLVIVFLKQARLRERIYAEQQHSVEAHLSLLKEQAAWVADSRAQLAEQIELVGSLSAKEKGGPAASYLAELKEQYRAFLAGIRCKDQMVDALLCYKEALCSQQKISTDFSLQQYDRGGLDEQEVVTILLLLFDGAVRSCQEMGPGGHISLYMALVKGQFLVEMGYSGGQALTKEGLRFCLARHDGTMFQERTRDGRKVRILLQAGQAAE